MAAPNHASPARSTPVLHRSYTDVSSSAESLIKLPNGPCNFGGAATRCGCRRFWSEQIDTSNGRKSWCMCEHHACYHDPGTVDLSSEPPIHVCQAPQSPAMKIEPATQKGLSGATAYSRASSEVSSAFHGINHNAPPRRGFQSSDSRMYMSHLGSGPNSMQIPDSFPWPQLSHSRTGSLPPIPAQCLLPGENHAHRSPPVPKTATPQSSLPRAAPTNGCKSLQLHTAFQNTAQSEDYIESATELATPTPRPSPDLGLFVAQFDNILTQVEAKLPQQLPRELADNSPRFKDVHSSPGPRDVDVHANTEEHSLRDVPGSRDVEVHGNTEEHPLSAIRLLIEPLHAIVGYLRAYPDLMHIVEGHGERLDGLELSSFSEPDFGHVNDKLEDLDARINEIESKISEMERTQELQQSVSVNESFCSSTSSALIAAAIDRVDTAATTGREELKAHLEAMGEQLKELQAATLPTRTRPWEMEVIFLPFGAELRGIWSTLENFPPSQRSRNNSLASDDASQATLINKAQVEIDRHQERWEDVMNPDADDDDWLVAKACGVGSRVYERLRSRGMVRTVEVISSDARDLQTAIYAAFGNLSGFISTPMTNQEASPHFMGLQAMFIPLRKIHKDSRLRFLQPEEMVTPALWTPAFIQASVAMRASGMRRLFVTHRDSYLQHHGDHQSYWSWQTIRELDRVHSKPSTEIGEADALEACWQYDEKLDGLPSMHTSFSSQHSSLSIRPATFSEVEKMVVASSPSDHFSSQGVSPVVSEPPENRRKKKSPTLSRSKPQRNASMPHLPYAMGSPTLSKRRISPPEETGDASAPRRLSVTNMKRRRVTKSPSRPRDTPRRSIDPPSPFISEQSVPRKRSTTPHGYTTGYATPHSGKDYVDMQPPSVVDMERSDGDGSTTDEVEAELEYDDGFMTDQADQGHQPEDVWEGMEEQLGSSDDEDGRLEVLEEQYLRDDFDGRSDSAPSEYPIGAALPESLGPEKGIVAGGGSFYVHIDEDVRE